jgi:hypothetical protein
MSVDERLAQVLKDAKDWEKRATSITGLFLLKLPGLKGNPPSIAIEINPVAAELKWTKENLSNPKAAELADRIDRVIPHKKERSSTTSTDTFEV